MFVRKYIRDSIKADSLISQLAQADELIMDFAKNPMLLKMLIQVGLKEQIQPNFGLLFQKFIKWIFERERKKALQFDEVLKEKILSDLAFQMRLKSLRAIEFDNALLIIANSIKEWREDISAIKFLNEVLDNRILIKNNNKQISFFHELVLEYYTAIKLKEFLFTNLTFVLSFANKSDWYEPIIILSGIVAQPDELIRDLYPKNLVLAARCISSGSSVSNMLKNEIFLESQRRLEKEEKDEHETITALLELSTSDSFRLVIKHLAEKKYSFTTALRRCQRPEIIATKLLNFGLTGKHRIRQCLRVFIGRPNSVSFINSTPIGNAQILLMSGGIEVEDLYLIEKLGISTSAFEKIKARVLSIVQNEAVRSKSFIKACELLPQLNCDNEIYSLIKLKVEKDFSQYVTGDEFFKALRVFKIVANKINLNEIIENLFTKIVTKKYYVLLLVYIKTLNKKVINNEEVHDFIKKIIPEIHNVRVFIQYKEEFPECFLDEQLLNFFEDCIENKKDMLDVFTYCERIINLLQPKHFFQIRNLLVSTDKAKLKTTKLLMWVKKLNLTSYFENCAFIRSTYTYFGFAVRIDTGETYYFKFKNFRQENQEIKINTIIKINKISYDDPIKNESRIRHPRIESYQVIH